MSLRNNNKQVAGTYVFGILIFVTLAAVIFFGSGINPQDKGQIVRVLCAAGAGLVASFVCGKLVIQKGNLPGWSNAPITASGGFALFLIVYYGWGGVDPGKGGSRATGTETNAVTHKQPTSLPAVESTPVIGGPKTNTVTVPLSAWGPFTATGCRHPTNSAADTDFKGHGPKVNWSVSLVIKNQKSLAAIISYHAIEWENGRVGGDKTEACGTWDEPVYNAPPGQRILTIVDDAKDGAFYVDTDHNSETATGNLYPKYVLYGDGDDDDVGIHTKIEAPSAGKVRVQIVSD